MYKIKQLTEASEEYVLSIQSLLNDLTSSPQKFSLSDLNEIVESETSHLFLLFEGEIVGGMLTIGIYKSPTGLKAWIEDVVIDSKQRGKGLGKLLMLHAISYSKSLGANSLMLTSRPQREAANKLYQSLGFTQKKTNVYKMEL